MSQNMLTVAQLINHLQSMDQNAPVVVMDAGSECAGVWTVQQFKDHKGKVSCILECEVIEDSEDD